MEEFLLTLAQFIAVVLFIAAMVCITHLVTIIATVYWEMKKGGGGFKE